MNDLCDGAGSDDRSKEAACTSEKQKRKEPRRLTFNAPTSARKDNLRNGAQKEKNVRDETNPEPHPIPSSDNAVVEDNLNPSDGFWRTLHENELKPDFPTKENKHNATGIEIQW